MKILLKKPYIYFIILIFLIYLILNIFVSGFYNTIPLIIAYANNINWFKLGVSIILSLITGALIAINSVHIYIKYKERKQCVKEGAITGLGTIGGLATGFCPLCITGLFPILFGFFGISFSLASLPFQGIEIQIIVVLVLLTSLIAMNKK